MKPVVTFGEIMLRLAPPGFERLLQSPVLIPTPGGAEANAAVALAMLGAPVRFVTVLPENPLADAVIGELRRFGVDPSHIARGPGRLGLYFVEPGANQRPSKVVYDREFSAIALAQPGVIDWDRVFAGPDHEAGWLHLSGITPAISASAAALTRQAAEFAKRHGITVSCDLNYRKNLWKWGKTAQEVMTELVALVDLVIANEEDVQITLGVASPADVRSGRLSQDHYRDLSERVLAAFPNLRAIAITLRESHNASHNGWSACLHNRDQFLTSRAYDITHIVDRVGAGDSFSGGLIYGWNELASAQEALEFATALSCLKHSIPGDFSRISRGEVMALLKEGGSGRVQR